MALTEIRYKHNERLENYGGHRLGRFMLPDPAAGRGYRQVNEKRDILNFVLRPGDRCPDDAHDKTKERAYLVFDADPRKSDRAPNTLLRMATALDMQKTGPVITSWWFAFTQWNQRPGSDGVWRPPPFSLGLKVKNGKEVLVAFARHLDRSGNLIELDAITMPFERRRYNVVADFVCSNGEPGGLCRLTIDGKVIGEYKGPTGYPGGPVYAALGIYRAVPKSPADIQHVKYEGFREGAVI